MCQQPLTIKATSGKDAFRHVPCGACPKCIKQRISHWSVRLDNHLKVVTNPLFVTLTYATPHLKWHTGAMCDLDSGYQDPPSLYKRDVQLFMKKLRKSYAKLSSKKISYYAVGEYGTKYGRPHYHILLFNMDFPDLIETSWVHGTVDIRPMLDGATGYALKYLTKRKDTPKSQLAPFSLSSLRMGLNYLSDAVVAYHRQHYSMCYYTLPNGMITTLPRYYKQKIWPVETGEYSVISNYLGLRSQKLEHDKLETYLKHHPWESRENAISNLELSNYYLSLPERLQETF